VRAYVLGTGSSGNALLVESHGTRVLVDAGLGPRALMARLQALGVAIEEVPTDPSGLRTGPPAIDAIVATHQHGDHFGGVEKIARAFGATIYLHAGIEAGRVRRRFPVRELVPGKPFRIGPLEIDSEHVPHDAPQVAVRVADADHAIGVATDVGRPTARLAGLLARCDVALLEANHCPELLAFGPYPTHLRARVAGGLGHLSNPQAAELAARLVGSRLGRLYLGHLSRSNNTPERALETVAAAARRIDVQVLPEGAVATLDIRRSRSFQLGLPFA